MYKPPIHLWLHALKAYERHITAAGMAGGFTFDYFMWGRVDHAVTQTLLIVYLSLAALSIMLLHWLEARQERQSKFAGFLRSYLPAVTQFCLGTLWSAFLVFYARSGVVAGSWPFLLLLVGIFVGNEVFKKYHVRLIFTTTLFFFALFSYCVFMLPVFFHAIGQAMFLFSGIVAVMIFAGFLWLLNRLSVAQLGEVKWKIAAGGVGVYALLTALYFLNLLPPLPLSLQHAGVYHSICRIPAAGSIRCVGTTAAVGWQRDAHAYYLAEEEPASWTRWLGVPRTIHVADGKPVIVFGAVFAPVDLNTTTYYVWSRHDDKAGAWKSVQRITNRLRGGRDKGYRGYSFKTNLEPGLWRVDVLSIDNRLIGRVEFKLVNAPAPQPGTIVKL